MYRIKTLSLFTGHVNALGSNNAQAIAFKTVNDFASQIALCGIWFNDRKCAL